MLATKDIWLLPEACSAAAEGGWVGGANDSYQGEMVCFISAKHERAMRETRQAGDG